MGESGVASGMDRFIAALADASPVIGLVLLVVGGVYLFFGKWLFRVLVAGFAVAVGLEVGRLLGAHLGIEGFWFPLLLGVVAGAFSWPMWQVVVFLGAGGALALIVGELVHAQDVQEHVYLIAALLGLVVGGLMALWVMPAAEVVISALVGAIMIFLGVLAIGYGTQPLVGGLLESFAFGLVFLMTLFGAGVGVQVLLPTIDEARKRRLDLAVERSKADDNAESRRRYAKFLTGGAG